MLQYIIDSIFEILNVEFAKDDSRLYFKTCYALDDMDECHRTYQEPERREDGKPRDWIELERLARRDELPPGIMDLLGWYNDEFPDSIFLCHRQIGRCAETLGVPFHYLWDVVCIHELAHLIHHRLNPDQFMGGHQLFPSRTDYVEGWAQYCTWIVVQKLGGWHEVAFNRLNQGAPEEYHYYRLFDKHEKSDVVNLFLCKNGWMQILQASIGSYERERWVPEKYQDLLIDHIKGSIKPNPGGDIMDLKGIIVFTHPDLVALKESILKLFPEEQREYFDMVLSLRDLGFYEDECNLKWTGLV